MSDSLTKPALLEGAIVYKDLDRLDYDQTWIFKVEGNGRIGVKPRCVLVGKVSARPQFLSLASERIRTNSHNLVAPSEK